MSIEPEYIDKGAIFSADKKYRYRLWRTWDNSKKAVLFVMLNPSTADENKLDPTVRRCLGYAIDWGYGRLDVCNIFALRATNPKELYSSESPVGENPMINIEHILIAAQECDKVIVAWGNHGCHTNRGDHIIDILKQGKITPYFLSMTQKHQPAHPLYLERNILPMEYD
jgi:hypothetical protein